MHCLFNSNVFDYRYVATKICNKWKHDEKLILSYTNFVKIAILESCLNRSSQSNQWNYIKHYINKLSMCKTVIPITVWRQHTLPWYHQQLRTSISQLSELSLFEYKIESRKKIKKAKIDLIKKNWSKKQKIDIYWLYNFFNTDPTTVKFCFHIVRVIFYFQKKIDFINRESPYVSHFH